MKTYIIFLVAIILSAALGAQLSVYTETGIAFSGYNDARIPGTGEADLFSLTDDLASENVPHLRFNIHFPITPRHSLSFLATPLRIEARGNFDRDIRYRGETFLADEPIDAYYRFDSYRLQYRYHFRNQNMIIRNIGVSLKLRDAEIALTSGNKTATKTDLGLVPLIGFKLSYDINDKLAVSMDGEALGSQFGRAEDILTSIDYKVDDRFTIKAGYRILEGGADVDEVYSFALIHYATLGLQVSF